MSADRRGLTVVAIALFVASATILARPTPVSACQPAPATPAQLRESADVVFVGTVARLELFAGSDSPYTPGNSWWQHATLAVSESWKGVAASPVGIMMGTQRSSDATCGFDLELGRSYLVLARIQREGGLRTSASYGTRFDAPDARVAFGLGPGHPVASAAADVPSGIPRALATARADGVSDSPAYLLRPGREAGSFVALDWVAANPATALMVGAVIILAASVLVGLVGRSQA